MDALKIMQHFTGMYYLSGLKLKAAEVDNSGFINATDALFTARRFVGMVNSFPSGDWTFNTSDINITQNEVVTHDFNGLCVGDVDGSFIPAARQSPELILETSGEQIISATGTTEIPLRSGFDASVGSLSLVLNLPDNQLIPLEIRISEKAPAQGNLVYHFLDGQLRLAWYSVGPWVISQEDVLFRLKVSVPENISSGSVSLILGEESGVTDLAGCPIGSAVIRVPLLKIQDAASGIRVFPNPARTRLNVELAETPSNNSVLEIYDITGRLQTRIAFPWQMQFGLDLSGLAKGMYFLRLLGDKQDYRTSFRVE
ncbi:MAG: T9SS type A sorting domain-containing protein [Bacteroidetes bacterium]|nr:T9SS type A sorting domain-containing protein [Bacteroidota bacterium]